MGYYDITKYKFILITRSDKPPKKYMAILENKKTGRPIKVHFGDKRYSQYKDSSGLGLYSHLDHKDKKRRDAYRKRHMGFIRKGYYSPGLFSMVFLWS